MILNDGLKLYLHRCAYIKFSLPWIVESMNVRKTKIITEGNAWGIYNYSE